MSEPFPFSNKNLGLWPSGRTATSFQGWELELGRGLGVASVAQEGDTWEWGTSSVTGLRQRAKGAWVGI